MKYQSRSWARRVITQIWRRSVPLNLTHWLLRLALLPMASLAAPPPNDGCNGAEVIPADASFPYFTTLIPDVREATGRDDPSPICTSNANHSVWYRFSPTNSAHYTCSVGTDSGTTLPDTDIAVYESPTANCGGDLTLLACKEDEAGLLAAARTNLVEGKTYFIVVWTGLIEPMPPNTALRMKVSIAVAPTNDVCAGAYEIPSSGLTDPIDTTLAGDVGDPPPPPCATNGLARGLWYRFTPTNNGPYVISTRDGTTVADTLIAVYSVNVACGTRTDVACEDSGDGKASVLTQLVAGRTYYIVVWDVSEELILSETTVQLRVQPAPQPMVTTLSATNLTTSSGQLTALVNPNGSPTGIWFEWGETPQYGMRTAVARVGGGATTLFTNRFIAGYGPDLVYYFRAVATNAGGRVEGTDNTFMYSTVPPTISASSAGSNVIFSAQFEGNPGQVYQVFSSTNVTNPRGAWEVIGRATYLGGGQFRFNDPNTAAHPHRFYYIGSP